MSYYSGKTASIANGVTTLTTSDWGLNLQCEAVDVTNMTSTNGRQENVAGIFKATISGSGPYSGASGITLGSVITFTIKYEAAHIGFTCPARVTQISIKASVRGAVEFDFQAESTGDWTIAA